MPMTGAERVAKHRQRQVDRIAQLERELADLKHQQPVSNVEIDAEGHKRFSAETVARVLGVTEATVLRAAEDGLLSAKEIEGQLLFGGKSLAVPSATAALEACAGTVGRGFAAAEVTGPDSLTRALTPSIMEMIGRSLIRRGEVVFLIDTQAGKLRLIPAETHDVEGGPFPEEWEYRLTLGGPSRTLTMEFAPAASVLHFKYAADPSTPYRGNGPIAVANLAGRLSAETVRALAEESSSPVGRLLGIPTDGEDATVQALKTDIASAKGKVALLESGDWGNAGGDAKLNLKTERFGAEPPSSLVELVDVSSREVYSAVGLNAALWGGAGGAGATREAWRLCLFSVLAPLGRLVQAELQGKLEDSVTLSWQELRASDLSGRARAFQSMVGGGMAVAEAVSVAGLMVED